MSRGLEGSIMDLCGQCFVPRTTLYARPTLHRLAPCPDFSAGTLLRGLGQQNLLKIARLAIKLFICMKSNDGNSVYKA